MTRDRGQAAVETMFVVPAALIACAGIVAGGSWIADSMAVQSAAGTAAAEMISTGATPAAGDVLPDRLADTATVNVSDGVVTVTARPSAASLPGITLPEISADVATGDDGSSS